MLSITNELLQYISAAFFQERGNTAVRLSELSQNQELEMIKSGESFVPRRLSWRVHVRVFTNTSATCVFKHSLCFYLFTPPATRKFTPFLFHRVMEKANNKQTVLHIENVKVKPELNRDVLCFMLFYVKASYCTTH